MTRDDIISMAREAGGCFENLPLCDAWLFYEDEHLERFAALVAAEKDKEIKRLQDMLYEQLGELTALRAEKQMRTRIEQHNCTLDSPSDAYGIAMDICYEKDDGTYWVSNGEYASQVNYCPVCGAKAPKQVEKQK